MAEGKCVYKEQRERKKKFTERHTLKHLEQILPFPLDQSQTVLPFFFYSLTQTKALKGFHTKHL